MMKLTKQRKRYIDSLSYSDLELRWKFTSLDDPNFTGEVKSYWKNRMKELRSSSEGIKVICCPYCERKFIDKESL